RPRAGAGRSLARSSTLSAVPVGAGAPPPAAHDRGHDWCVRSPARLRPVTVAAALALAFTAVAGCTQVVPGRASAVGLGTSGVGQTPTQEEIELGTAAVRAVQEIWRDEFPRSFDQPWQEITTTVPVHTDDPRTKQPPCVRNLSEVVGQ